MITLTTDFGYREPFVGQIKGVLLSIAPEALVVDLTHGIPAHDIRAAALAIYSSYRYFPKGSVHMAVVDPGVGSSRAAIIVEACGHLFVGPDNGLFTLLWGECAGARAWAITSKDVMRDSPGHTFHGRDLFAPVAAWLHGGRKPSEMGQPMKGIVTLSMPEAVAEGGALRGEVIHVDVFGNAITNIRAPEVQAMRDKPGGPIIAEAGGRRCPIVEYYAEGVSGPHALVNSDGWLEIFVFERSASEALALEVGSSVKVIGG